MKSCISPEYGESYPQPLRGPSVPYRNLRKNNPRISGWLLLVLSFLLESFGFVRRWLWRNAGFGSLRDIRNHIGHVEPRFIPTVYPSDIPASKVAHDRGGEMAKRQPLDVSAQRSCAVVQYHDLFLSGELTPLAVVNAILPLIQRDISPTGEHSAAWIDVKVDMVIKAAEASTLRYKNRQSRGPLDGIPTAVKDAYDIDGYSTSLGSAHKTITGIRLIVDTSGINITHGTPRNPYNKQYYTGGSSSGCAYAVAAGLIPIAIGTDGGGSIRVPASFCSVYGLKPTHGRLSYLPGQNHNITCEVNGPVAVDMGSLAAVYSVISQPHPTSPFPPAPEMLLSTSSSDNRPKVLGVPEVWLDRAKPGVQELCRSMVDWLVTNKGYSIVPIDIPFTLEGQIADALTILSDVATAIPDTRGTSCSNRILVALGRETSAVDYLLAQRLRNVPMQHLAWLWREYPNMVIVTPTTACAGWPIRSDKELKYGISDGNRTLLTMEYVWLANFCGAPSLSVPAGYVVPEGQPGPGRVSGSQTPGAVPVGLMVTSKWTREDVLMQFGVDAAEIGTERQRFPPA